jgi:hypothetical protein
MSLEASKRILGRWACHKREGWREGGEVWLCSGSLNDGRWLYTSIPSLEYNDTTQNAPPITHHPSPTTQTLLAWQPRADLRRPRSRQVGVEYHPPL